MYTVSGNASAVLANEQLFLAVSEAVQHDLETDLRTYNIEDRATLRRYETTLMQIAILRSHHDAASTLMRQLQEHEDKPAERELAGWLAPALAGADRVPAEWMATALLAADRLPSDERQEAFALALGHFLHNLPYDTVAAELRMQRGQLEAMSDRYLAAFVAEAYDPKTRNGKMSSDVACGVINIGFLLRRVLPYKATAIRVLDEFLNRHAPDVRDIWAARTVNLQPGDRLKTVTVAIWDFGLDPAVFPRQMWTNSKEIPNNGKDDDNNGFVDDVHGIAWSYGGQKSSGDLCAVPLSAAELNRYGQDARGFADLGQRIDSPDARALRDQLKKMSTEETKSLLRGVSLYTYYAHGTHVAGIAAAGNPAIRLMSVRVGALLQAVPPPPDMAWAKAQADMMRDSIRYMRAHGVRVVNISWEQTRQEIETSLEKNGLGKDAADRRAQATQMFNVISMELRQEMAAASGMLFVAAAADADTDVSFDQTVPAGFDLPNLITVGAADALGNEAPFTNYGKVTVYANGYQVESVAPGGARQRWSGTSMAAPQVTNLAAKLYARYPGLTISQLKKLIVDGASEKEVLGRKIRLIDGRRSFALAAETQMSASATSNGTSSAL